MLENVGDLFLEGWQIPLHHGPDFRQVNAEIVVDQYMAHFDDLWPRNLRWVLRKAGVSLLAASPMIWMW